MESRAPRKTLCEQLELIMSCRASGLTDSQWCKQNGINPGTFYNWVKRMRKRGFTLTDDNAAADCKMVVINKIMIEM